ncbi:MAG: lipopolysaccharide kinase InaA family protein [Planctomycetota bacterium]
MSFVARLPALPEGFVLERGERGALACRPEDLDALRAAGFRPDDLHRTARGAALEDADVSGREPLGRLVVDGVECLARRFTHGGLARGITGRRFLDPARPFVELVVSERLRALGIGTPRVVAARAVPTPPVGFELTLVTERIPDTVDVGQLLGGVRSGAAQRARLRPALAVAGRLIGRLHDAGLYHADLQPANVLVPTGGDAPDRAWILDLDRSRFPSEGGLDESLRMRNLGRLWRHVRRREREYGSVLISADMARFLRAYGLAHEDLRAGCAAIEREADAGSGLHRLGWWIDRAAGRADDPRASGQSARPADSRRG